VARCLAHVLTNNQGAPQATSAPVGLSPAQFRTAYQLPYATRGTGQIIAIVDAYDDPNVKADLDAYDRTFGLPAFPSCGSTTSACFTKVNQTGGSRYPSSDSGWGLEISLDVELAHAACPNCGILLVEASSSSFTNLMTAEDYAASHASVVSNSWGGSEFSGETAYDSHFRHAGLPITFSAGDDGYGVEYPAASQYVTAVGGTTLTLNANNTRATETAWSGTGSGCSAYEPKPSWQTDTGCPRRTVADVSADADPNSGAAVYDTYGYQGWLQVGGTSLASPLVAASYALAGNGSSTTYGSFPYTHRSSLFDVTSGTNGTCTPTYLCSAIAGFDGPTGLGAPIGTAAF
jgi:subtilase family serine protease